MSSYAGVNRGKITNQFTAGGMKKAGLGQHIGMGPFVYVAIGSPVHFSAGRAPNTIPSPANYPFPWVNQLSGVGMPWRGPFGASADGVNLQTHNRQLARIRAGPPGWGMGLNPMINLPRNMRKSAPLGYL